MKYIKTYEKKRIFKIGDVVILNAIDLWQVYPYVKIIDKSQKNGYIQAGYYIQAYLRQNMLKMNFWLDDSDIERLATPEEIEEFELLIDTKKYNV